VGIAGWPLSNLLMAIIAFIPFQIGLVSAMLGVYLPQARVLPTLDKLLYEFVYINRSFDAVQPDPLAAG
jgi:hypothetical protein